MQVGVVRFLVVSLLAVFGLAAVVQAAEPISATIVGSEFTYTVQPGDSLTLVGARFGETVTRIAVRNGLAPDAWLRPGQHLRIENRHIVPAAITTGILINIPQRMLFLLAEGKVVGHYPVGLGRPSWPTPVARFTVKEKATDKAWVVPRSIQEELRREADVVRTLVPPGPDNPLGKHWIGLSIPGYGIHGTIAPASVFHFQSHGCIRMQPDDIADLYERISEGTPGRLVYEPVLIARGANGEIYLEAHPDVYARGQDAKQDAKQTVERTLRAARLDERADWSLLERALAERSGGVVRIDRGG